MTITQSQDTVVTLQKPPIHILHHGDSDGRFAGYAAWRHFRNNGKLRFVKFYEVQYGQPFPLDIENLTKEDEVYILDFSYDRATLDAVYEKVGKLVVLEHHETAQERLVGAPYVHFDITKSGALLGWEYFFPNVEPPVPCLLVNDFDLWQWKYKENTEAFEAWLQYDQVGQNWEKWEHLCFHEPTYEHAMVQGKIVATYENAIINKFINNPRNIVQNSLFHEPSAKCATYAIFNGISILHSQLSAAVYKKFEVDMTISWRVKGKEVTFSVRSPNPEKFSAKVFAESYGGGGHAPSAGFGLSLEKGLDLIKHLMSKT